jgi:hypothetical protein
LTDFDEALVDHLLGFPGLAALVATRIFPDYFPQSEQLPAIAYTLEDDSSQHIFSRARQACAGQSIRSTSGPTLDAK